MKEDEGNPNTINYDIKKMWNYLCTTESMKYANIFNYPKYENKYVRPRQIFQVDGEIKDDRENKTISR